MIPETRAVLATPSVTVEDGSLNQIRHCHTANLPHRSIRPPASGRFRLACLRTGER